MKNVILVFVLFSLCGCAALYGMQPRVGPITGKEYYPTKIKEYEKEVQEDFFRKHTNIQEKVKNAIMDNEIFIGMTEAQLLASRGNPCDINRTVTQSGAKEQWVFAHNKFNFGWCSIASVYVYIEEGKVTSWQD